MPKKRDIKRVLDTELARSESGAPYRIGEFLRAGIKAFKASLLLTEVTLLPTLNLSLPP